MFACLSKKHNFDIESVIFGCHFCAQTLRNLKQSSILSFDLPETWNSRHFCRFGRQKRETLVNFVFLSCRNVKHSSLLRVRTPETWNSRQICGPHRPKRETVVTFAASGVRNVKQSSNVRPWASQAWNTRHFPSSRPLPASSGAQNRCFLKGFQLKLVTFPSPGRARPAPALKFVTFKKDFI